MFKHSEPQVLLWEYTDNRVYSILALIAQIAQIPKIGFYLISVYIIFPTYKIFYNLVNNVVCMSLMVSAGVIKHHGHQQRKSEKELESAEEFCSEC